MRYLTPEASEATGDDQNQRSIDAIPSGMDADPRADEEIIDQKSAGAYPEPVSDEAEPTLSSDNLADSIAYALDGSGPGITGDKPNVSGHDVITEGTTGAGPEEEDSLFNA